MDLPVVKFSRMDFSPGRRSKARDIMINGPAGFKKTVPCARIVEHLLATAKTPVAYFFFSSYIESRNDPCEAIRYWISRVMFQNKIELTVCV